jgi:hypothetical protein
MSSPAAQKARRLVDHFAGFTAPDNGAPCGLFPTPARQDSSMLVPLAAADCLLIRVPHAPPAREQPVRHLQARPVMVSCCAPTVRRPPLRE